MARPKKYESAEEARRAKLESNARRQAEKLLRIEVQPEKAEGEKIKAAAQAAGQSTQGYILQAVREHMEKKPEGESIRISVPRALVEQKAGEEDPKQFLKDIISKALE